MKRKEYKDIANRIVKKILLTHKKLTRAKGKYVKYSLENYNKENFNNMDTHTG